MPDGWRDDDWQIFAVILTPIVILGVLLYLVQRWKSGWRYVRVALTAAVGVALLWGAYVGWTEGKNYKALFGGLLGLLALAFVLPLWWYAPNEPSSRKRRKRLPLKVPKEA